MLAKAAVHYEAGQGLEIEQLEVLEPRKGEVLVRYVASGVCHSDLHHIQGKVPHPTPVVFGHEGAGIVEAVGPDVSLVKVGDHVLTSYIPSCGRCPWCVTGRPNLCDLRDLPRYLMHDGTSRFRKANQEIYQYLQVSTYADRAVVPEVSLIPIRKDAPLDVICLVSCGVMTGAGSVMNRAKVTPGSSIAVFGCGGIGLNAIQMAAIMGASKIIAVDVFDQK
ncbi:MAG: alcohol dehydrogenase catalytic domain-containing protein, partial [Chloroflexota bacterium]|nr:alcohol dehydrogenase catalytic domain-containing protein [Chloroflexota bacterium]